ncbi:MAG: radical SAM protein [Desulfobacteraceae bacterium]|nr:MAG: radical SAM protein [Desulfobacteraceae bacterium]
MQKRTVAFSKHASNLFFHILTRCNLACAHCYINPAQHGSARLSIDTIEQWLALFARRNPDSNVIFLGGEPTLHPDLFRAVRYARQLGYTSITIDTNGYLFHDILDRITPDDVDFISFSLDGATPETNDAIRGKGCFDQVVAGIRTARRKGFSCSMIYTVSEHNIHELAQMPELISTMGLERFFIQVIGLRGESSKDNTLQVSRRIWLDVIPGVAHTIAESGITVTYPKVFLDPGQDFECAGNVAQNYFVFPNGRVYQCPVCEDYALHSYEIRDNELVSMPPVNESDLFKLSIPEGCVMNKLVQPGNIEYLPDGRPAWKIACCLLKEELSNRCL